MPGGILVKRYGQAATLDPQCVIGRRKVIIAREYFFGGRRTFTSLAARFASQTQGGSRSSDPTLSAGRFEARYAGQMSLPANGCE
jgi:hypothetical protein